ncbi:hypothetical protein SDJN03_26263, partial [Cucurbita argyrosperma subsp. sororia]
MPSAFFFFFFSQSTNLQAHRQNSITFPPENPTFPTCSDSYSKELDFGYELDFSLPIRELDNEYVEARSAALFSFINL